MSKKSFQMHLQIQALHNAYIDHSSRIKFSLVSSGSLVIQCNMTIDISFMIQIEKRYLPPKAESI
jgi:hypothetical protein